MKRFNPFQSEAPSAEPLVAQRKAPQSPGATEFPVTLSENVQKGGLELRFPNKPSEAILGELKAHGWRWSRFSVCWYHLNTPENRSFANRFLSTQPPVVTATVAALAAPGSAGVSPAPTLDPQPSNVLTVQFSPETTFPVIPQRPVVPPPLPAWRRALMGR